MADRRINCLIMTSNIRDLMEAIRGQDLEERFKSWTEKDFVTLVEAWQIQNNKTVDDIPTIQEINGYWSKYINGDGNISINNIVRTIDYTPTGKEKQTYTIIGEHIFNKNGVEVFKEDSTDRNRIFANLAYKGGRAVVVSYKGINYVVNNRGQIMTTSKSNAGKIMQWPENNGDRKAIINLANAKFDQKAAMPVETQQIKQESQTPIVESQPLISREKLDTLIKYNPELTFKNSRQRRDRANLIARMFTTSATKLFKEEKEKLEALAAEGNTMAANRSNKLTRERFVLQNIKEILDDIENMFDVSKTTVEFLTEVNKERNKNLSEEQAKELAEKQSPIFAREYQKVLDNWELLLLEAMPIIKVTENINIDLINNTADQNIINNESNNDRDDDDDNNDGESVQNYKEGWMVKARQLNERDTLSVRVRKMLNSIKKVDRFGNVETDDLGFVRYIEADYAHNVLLNIVSEKVDDDRPYDLINVLKEEAKNYRWINQVIAAINPLKTDSDEIRKRKESLRAQFYSNFKTEFNGYYIEYFKDDKDGVVTVKTKPVNLRANIIFVINSWRDHIESGSILDELSIYDGEENPELDPTKTEKRNNFLNNIINQYNKTRSIDGETKGKTFLSDSQNAENVYRLTRILGIEMPIDEMVNSLSEQNNLWQFLNSATVIFNELDKIKSRINENGYLVYEDIIDHFGSTSKQIATALNYIPDSAVMNSFRENGNTYQSNTPPSYKGKIMRALKKWDKSFVQEQFKDVDWFFSDGRWYNDWLRTLESNSDARRILDLKTVLHADKIDFNGWDNKLYSLSMLVEFMSDPNNNTAWYPVPLQADVESADYMRFYRYSDEECLDKMVDTVLQEFNRIQLVYKRQNITDPNFRRIAYYDIIKDKEGHAKGVTFDPSGKNIISRQDGAEFKFFPQLNTRRIDNNGNKILFYDALAAMISADNRDMANIRSFIKEELRDIQKEKARNAWQKFSESGVFDKTPKGQYIYFSSVKDEAALKKLFYNFMLNYAHAYTQMVELFTTDLAYYKNLNDFQKRFKEVYAMTLKPYFSDPNDTTTTDKYSGKIRNIILADREIISNVKDEIIQIVDNQVALGNMSKQEANYIKDTYSKKVNVTDGQAFRTLKSFKRMMESIGEWTDELDKAYNRLRDGSFTQEDQRVIFQTVKPFVFTQNVQDSHVDGKKIKKPIQFKNSEAILLTIYGPQSKSTKLRALIEFCEDNDIDVIQFSSAGKVGNQGVINYDANEFDSEEQYKEFLESQTKMLNPDGVKVDNPEVIHEVNMSDWGIVAGNPEHLMDAEVLFGTQIRKLAIADLLDTDTFNVKGYDKPMSKQELVKEYSRLITAQSLKGMMEVIEELSDIEQLEKVLQKELNSNSRYDESLKEACMLVDDGEGNKIFNIPLHDPIQGIRIQNLINSIIKRRTVKHKIRGGSTTQASSYGVDNTINIRFLNNNGEFIFNENEWNGIDSVKASDAKLLKAKKKEFNNDFSAYKAANKAASEAYWEVYMPVWDSKIYDICYDEETKTLDINKLPEELRYGIIERIPTEDKYSVQRIYVKDFLPGNVGSQLLLPADVTTIVGADFDVDHNYDMMYDFDYFFDKKKAFNSRDVQEKALWREKNEIDPWESWYQYIKQWMPEYRKSLMQDKDNWTIRTKSINKEKPYIEQHDSAINNALLNILTAIFTTPSVAGRQVNPGNFDENKRVMYLLSILKNIDENTYKEEIEGHEDDINYLKEKASLYAGIVDPTTPITQIQFHIANATGGKMIGIYANNNGSHSLMQYTELALAKPIVINGKTYQSLHDSIVKDDDGKILYYISKNLASFLAASVDNVKEPTLSAFNQNDLTTSATCLMLRLGVPIQSIGLFLNQPAILEVTKRYLNNVDRGKDAKALIEEVLKDYTVANVSPQMYKELYKIQDEDMIKAIIRINRGKPSNEDLVLQRIILNRFVDFLKYGDSLNKVTQAFRADTANGSNGPDIADTMIRQTRIAKVMSDKNLIGIPLLVGYDAYIQSLRNGSVLDINSLPELIESGELPIIDAFSTASLGGAQTIMQLYFPQYKKDVNKAYQAFMDSLKPNVYLSKKIINKFFEHLYLYNLMGLQSFSTTIEDGRILSVFETRGFFTNRFPHEFMKLRNKIEELKDNDFVKKLTIHEGTHKDPVDRIEFKNVGNLSTTQRGQVIKDWESLLFSSNTEVQRAALKLFQYCIYKQGLNFGPKSFIHLAPPSLRKMFPGYMGRIRDIMDKQDNYDQFVDQFIRNNIDNSQLVPVISPASSFTLTDNKGNPLDRVSLSVTSESDSIDKNILISDAVIDGKYYPTPHKFFSTNINNEVFYYALKNEEQGDLTWTGYYERIDKLGGFEYEYGVDATMIQTVISKEQNRVQASDNQREEREPSYDRVLSVINDITINDDGSMTIFDAGSINSYPAEEKPDASGKKPCR